MTSIEFAWLAGIIEGEGCIQSCGNSPVITVAMTDRDIIDKVQTYFGNSVTIRSRHRERDKKDVYTIRAYGRRAAALLMSIYPLLGERRQTKVKEVLERFRAHKSYTPRKGKGK